MPAPRDPMSYRAGDDDRERVAETLRRAAGDGRITLDELETRLETAYAARTYSELADVTSDLPPEAAPVPVRAQDDELLLSGAGGSVRRDGRWRVPHRVVVERKHGSVRLDFREAEFTAGVTALDVHMKHGSLTLILPDGATAQVDCQTSYGSVRSSVPAIQVPGHPHLVVTGEKAYGSLRVRYGYGRMLRRRR